MYVSGHQVEQMSASNKFWSYLSPTSHIRTVMRECCKGDDASQWENGEI